MTLCDHNGVQFDTQGEGGSALTCVHILLWSMLKASSCMCSLVI